MKPGDFEKVFRALNEPGVRYLVIGGVAAVLHGVERSTFDVDICLLLTPENLEAFRKVMAGLGYQPRLPVDWAEVVQPANLDRWRKEKNMKAMTFWQPTESLALEIDLVVEVGVEFSELSTAAGSSSTTTASSWRLSTGTTCFD